MQIIGELKHSKEIVRNVFRNLIPLMEVSKSSYTGNRSQLWLFHKSKLFGKDLEPGYFDKQLWDFCQRIFPGCNIGLLTFGGKYQGISSDARIAAHRDHTYSQPTARILNLGKAEFVLEGISYHLTDGEIIQFNCKQTHSISRHCRERFSLCLWKLNEAKGYQLLPEIAALM